jgi:hypothetical protein
MAVNAAICTAMLLLAGSVACGGRTSDAVTGSPADGAADAADAQGCMLLASSYDRSCRADTDCVLVPPGGDVCATCSNGAGCLFCNFASINQMAADTYRAALRSALAPYSIRSCTTGSCPTGIPQPVCDAGVCTARTTDFCP